MKKNFLIFFLIMLFLPLISINYIENAQGQDLTEINIGINDGGWIEYTNVKGNENALKNYRWVVDDSDFFFNTTLVNWFENKNYLNNSIYHVHIIDGVADEYIMCIDNPTKIDDNFRLNLEEFIKNGGGYIGRCGGSQIPPTHTDDKPDTLLEYYFIKQNAFLEDAPEIKTYVKLGFPIISQRFQKRYGPLFPHLPKLRIPQDPGALGLGAYIMYNVSKHKIAGVSLYLDIEAKDHPIFKDYHGNTIYCNSQGGGSFPYPPAYAQTLTRYPSECFDTHEQQKINIWEFQWSFPCLKILKIIIEMFANGLIQILDVSDLPPEWQEYFDEEENVPAPQIFQYLTSLLPDWKQTNNIAKTDLQNKSAIITFEYGKGRVILSGPHPANRIVSEDAYITNDIPDTDCNTIRKGLYRWKLGDDYIDNDSLIPNKDLWWYLRREAAWVSNQTKDDSYLPPVYNRSQVVDIKPYLQNSSEFPIYCCVGREDNSNWNWSDVNLTLYYKYKYGYDQWTNWTAYNSVYNRPYNFTFNTTICNGSGMYRFCSVLNTTENETSNWTCDDFPPKWDTQVYVNGSLKAEYKCALYFLKAQQPVEFNSNISSTKPGTTIDSYSWDFGDGTQSNSSNPIHIFTDDGLYNVTLTIGNSELQNDSITKTFKVHNNPPIVDFEQGYKIVFINEPVNFTDNSSDVDGNVSQYLWDFGDGTNSTIQNPNHAYDISGMYDVSLEILDDDNDTNVKVTNLLVIDSLVNKTISPDDNKWNTIQEAVDNSSFENFIYIENGSYFENIQVNKSLTLIGESKDSVVLHGSVSLSNPYDYELSNKNDIDFSIIFNMSGNQLLLHFNNDSSVGENYSNSSLVYDYSGEFHNGTNNGSIWTNSALKGAGAFNFNGFNNSIKLSNLSVLSDENISISSWIYWSNGTDVKDPIISQLNVSNGYGLYINNSNGKPVFQLDDTYVSSSMNLSRNEWHHIVGTHNHTSLKIYVDGVFCGKAIKNGAGGNFDCYVGFDNVSQYYNGLIDEVAIWNRTLTNEEIQILFNSNNGIFIHGVTFQDSNAGITLCDHSEISGCDLINHTTGIVFNNSSNCRVSSCNISDVDIGIRIIDSNPEYYYFNHLVDVEIDNVTSAIIVDNTSYLYVIRTVVNGSSDNLSFTNCDSKSILIIDSNSVNNLVPDIPFFSGPNAGEINVNYTFSAITNDSNNDQILYRFDWGDGNHTDWLGFYSSNVSVNASHKWVDDGNYQVSVRVRDVFDNESINTSVIIIDILPPVIDSVTSDPIPVGYGGNVTISAVVSDNMTGGYSGIDTVKINISSPADSCFGNYSMDYIGNDTYIFVFNNTWSKGQYNFSIWAGDKAGNNITTSGYCFNVSSFANITVCTIKDDYGDNEIVNLTDPPDSSYKVGYEFLDDGKVCHIWNKFDSYYFNTSNGIQMTNHKDEYWSTNVLMLGYYNNDIWNLIYRSDNLSGFSKNIKSDNETYVNITLWKDLTYQGYDFRLAVRYYLGVDDIELTVIPYVKNIDDEDITYNLGFGWELKDIQVGMTKSGDFIEIDGDSYFLNQTLNETYSNMSQPCFYIKENKTVNTFESLYLRWDENLNYMVKVESRTGQYNAPVILGIKIGSLTVGQEKYTSLFWHDASEITFYFDDYDSGGEVWTSNPSYMTDGSMSNYASTQIVGDVELCDNNTCPGDILGVISKVEIRAYGYYSMSQRDIYLRPVFNGTTDGSNNTFTTESTPSWSRWFDITNDGCRPSYPAVWTWVEIRDLDCDVESENLFGFWTLYCSKVEVRVTYNNVPGISSPYPADGATGISLTPVLNISVSDSNGDLMNLTWLSNSSGSWQVFGANSSISNHTYHQIFSNASENGQWWFWKINVSDDDGYNISNVYKFYTGVQSKIVNTGSADISGYLLIQVHYYNTSISNWTVADDTINETSMRTLAGTGGYGNNSSSVLGLDTLFNGLVNTSSLLDSFGNGTYRVYVAFRDPDGDVLICDDESLLETTYQFTISST